MSYNEPSVRFVFQENTEDINVEEAELPTLVVGPLYEVLEKETVQASGVDATLDPLSASASTYSWPEKRVGAVVDLAGTRSGYIDSQRKDLAPDETVADFGILVDQIGDAHRSNYLYSIRADFKPDMRSRMNLI